MWPFFRLTNTESKYSIKYYDPRRTERPVLRRMYGGRLNLSPNLPRDQFTFQISRRSRVMGLTVCGDITEFAIVISDVSGEQYLADPTPVAGLVAGYNALPLSDYYNNSAEFNGSLVAGQTLTPYIFEPNIILSPNNTLTIAATRLGPVAAEVIYQIDFTLHVYEFPGMPGSPL